jgi:ADP-dependent NAD(P)H-hydrate dehydratase / NAD(P)H-hydrate epimerase
VTMAALKIGLVSAPGFARAGRVRVAEIGIPSALAASTARAGLLEERDMRAVAPRTRPLDHKGRRGHVVIAGGSPGKRGAARLAAIAAVRAGAGLVTLAGPAGGGEIAAPDPVMTEAIEDARELTELLVGKASVVIGPGMTRGASGAALVDAVLAAGVPAVLDADALNSVVGRLGAVAAAAGPIVVTPHPGEAGRLLGSDAATVERDRLAAARALASMTRAVVVLKGARTIVCAGDFCAINPTGSPALATGGTGDVLAGAIAALLAQGLSAVDAARLGVWIHGVSGERAAEQYGPRGVSASEVADGLGRALGALAM